MNPTTIPITIARLPTFLISILLPPRPNPIKPTLSSIQRRFPPKQIEACQGRQNQRYAKYLRRRYAPGKDDWIASEKLDRKTRNSITSQIGQKNEAIGPVIFSCFPDEEKHQKVVDDLVNL